MAMTQPRLRSRCRNLHVTLAICAALAHFGAPAAQAELEHRIEPGDTLEALSRHYLGTPQLWSQLQTHNRIANPRRLQPGSILRIPMQLLPMGTAQASFVQGEARITPPGGGASTSLQAGQPLTEGARLQVAPDSFVTVRLADGTLIRIQADSDLQLQLLRRRGRAGNAQSVLELRRGQVETSVPPAGSDGRRFEIRTPKASTSVRGTRFAVVLDSDERMLTAVTEGQVAVQSLASHAAAMVGAGQGMAVAANGQIEGPHALLPAPDLSALPATMHEADFLSLTLTPVGTAVGYQVRVARDADFIEVVRDGVFTAPMVRMRTVEDGRYHLAVRAIDSSGLPGLIGQSVITVKTQPVPPLYQAPTPGATISRTQGELVCTQVVGSARYRIQVASDAGFTAPVLDETMAQHCGMRVAALTPGSYYWRSASLRDLPGGGSDQGPYASAQPFTVADNPSAPAALQVTGSGPDLQLHWSGQTDQSFRLQVAASEDFASPLVDERLNAPTWIARGLMPGSYFVRIQTRDPSGLESDFSTPRLIQAPAAVQSSTGEPVTSSDGRPLSRP